jgi:hypothetical protein
MSTFSKAQSKERLYSYTSVPLDKFYAVLCSFIMQIRRLGMAQIARVLVVGVHSYCSEESNWLNFDWQKMALNVASGKNHGCMAVSCSASSDMVNVPSGLVYG